MDIAREIGMAVLTGAALMALFTLIIDLVTRFKK